MLPYVAVGKSPLAHGWSTRHALLISLPLGLLILGVWRLIFSRLPSLWGLGFMALLLFAYTQAQYINYFQLQAFWVKNAAISQHLGQTAGGDEVDVFWIDDHFPVGWPEMNYYNREWTGLFRYTWPNSNAGGIYWNETAGGYYWLTRAVDYEPLIARYDPHGCQAILTIRRGDRPTRYSPEGLAIRYLFYHYLYPPGREEFLNGVVEIEVRRILAPQATLCPAEQALLPSLPPDDPLRNDNERGDKHLLRLLYIHLLESPIQPGRDLAAWKLAGLGQMDQTWQAQQWAAMGIEAPPYPLWLAEHDIDPDFYALYYQVSGLQAESTEP
jgi:hypothetical protein